MTAYDGREGLLSFQVSEFPRFVVSSFRDSTFLSGIWSLGNIPSKVSGTCTTYFEEINNIIYNISIFARVNITNPTR